MNDDASRLSVRRRIEVAAPQAHCFEVFVAMSDWWPPSHSIGRSPLAAAVIEPVAGGRWYERGADGDECDWGRVIAWEPPERLLLDWQIGGDFRHDPAVHTTVEVTFVALSAERTLVELEHRDLDGFGAGRDAAVAAISSEGGWGGLLALYGARATA